MFSSRKPSRPKSTHSTPERPTQSQRNINDGSLLFTPDSSRIPSTPISSHSIPQPSTPFSNKRNVSGNSSPSFRPEYASIKKSKKHEVSLISNLPKEILEYKTKGMTNFQSDACALPRGGLERRAGLAWYLLGTRLFVWKYLKPSPNQECRVVNLPQEVFANETVKASGDRSSEAWIIQFSLPMDERTMFSEKLFPSYFNPSVDLATEMKSLNIDKEKALDLLAKDAGLVMCHRNTMATVFWPRVMQGMDHPPVILHADEQWPSKNESSTRAAKRFYSGNVNNQTVVDDSITAMTTVGFPSSLTSSFTAIDHSEAVDSETSNLRNEENCLSVSELKPLSEFECIVILGCLNGSLWRIDFTKSAVIKKKLGRDSENMSSSSSLMKSPSSSSSSSLSSIRSILIQRCEDPSTKSLNRNYSNISETSEIHIDSTDSPSGRTRSTRSSRSFKEKSKEKCNVVEVSRKDTPDSNKCIRWRILLLVSSGLEAWDMDLNMDGEMIIAWSYDMLLDAEIQQEFPGQKQLWLLDFKLRSEKDSVSILASSLFKDPEHGLFKEFWIVSLFLPPLSKVFYPPFSPLLQRDISPMLESRSDSLPPYSPVPPSVYLSPVSPRPTDFSLSPSSFHLKMKGEVIVLKSESQVDVDMASSSSLQLEVANFPYPSFLILAKDGTTSIYFQKDEKNSFFQISSVWEYGKVLAASVIEEYQPLNSSSSPTVQNQWIFLTESMGIFSIKREDIEKASIVNERSSSVQFPSLQKEDEETNEEEENDIYNTNVDVNATNVETIQNDFDILQHAQLTVQNDKSLGNIPISPSSSFHQNTILQLFELFNKTSNVANVYDRVKATGAFSIKGKNSPFVCASRELVDLLPPRWVDTMVGHGGSEGNFTFTVTSQLLKKKKTHESFLHFLTISGCIKQLKEKQRIAMHMMMEDGEKLACLIKLNEIQSSRSLHHPLTSFNDSINHGHASIHASWDCILIAGNAIRKSNIAFFEYSNSTLFLSRPSSFSLFFSAMAKHAKTIVFKNRNIMHCNEFELKESIHRLTQLAEASEKVLVAVNDYKEKHDGYYPPPMAVEEMEVEVEEEVEQWNDWSIDDTVLNSLWEICSICIELWNDLHENNVSLSNQIIESLKRMGSLLLDKTLIHLKEKNNNHFEGVNRKEREDCTSKRDQILKVLYEYVKLHLTKKNASMKRVQERKSEQVISVHDNNGGDGGNNGKEEDAASMDYPSFIQIAEKHASYPHLYSALEDMNDDKRFHECMVNCAGFEEEDRFIHYVFQRFYDEKKHGRLLLLGETYPLELSQFLSKQKHLNLQWIHQIYVGKYKEVSSSLLQLSMDYDSIKQRRKMLCNAKLAALTDDDEMDSERLFQINSELTVLKIQEKAVSEGLVSESLVPRQELIESCLLSETKELFLSAFFILSVSPTSFLEANRRLVESAWVKAAEFDVWVEFICRTEIIGRDEVSELDFIKSSCLCKASNICYGLGSNGNRTSHVASFMPLFSPGERFSRPSVQSILSSKYVQYNQAAGLILEALKLGSKRKPLDDDVFLFEQ